MMKRIKTLLAFMSWSGSLLKLNNYYNILVMNVHIYGKLTSLIYYFKLLPTGNSVEIYLHYVLVNNHNLQ